MQLSKYRFIHPKLFPYTVLDLINDHTIETSDDDRIYNYLQGEYLSKILFLIVYPILLRKIVEVLLDNM